MDTASKMSAFTSMWKDPQKCTFAPSACFQCLCVLGDSSLVAKPPTVEHTISPVLPHSATTLPPPVRRDGSGSYHSSSPNPASPAVAEDGPGLANGSKGQAQALYDYTGNVSRLIRTS